MESIERTRSYHAVCRECPTERVFESADEAHTFVTEHADRTDHTVVAERVD